MAPPKKVKGKRGYKEIEHSEEEEEQVPEEGQAPEEVNPPMDVDEEDDQEELEEWSQEERKKLVSYGYSHSGRKIRYLPAGKEWEEEPDPDSPFCRWIFSLDSFNKADIFPK